MQDFHRPKQTNPYRAQQSHITQSAPKKTKKITLKLSFNWVIKIWDALENRETQSRVFAGIMALAMIMVVAIETRAPIDQSKRYDIANYEGRLLDDPVPLLGKQVTFDLKNQEYVYNEGYQQPKEVTGQIAGAKISAKFGAGKDKNVTVTDTVNNVGVTFKPQFALEEPRQNQNRIIYPIKGKQASKVFTLKANGAAQTPG